MSITDILRKNGFKIPPRLGIVIGRIPNRYKPFLGKLYQTRRQEIRMFDTLSDDQKKCFIFSRVKNIVDFAVANVPFYRDYYRQCGFSPEKLETFDDLERIPVISKKILLDYPLEYRTAECVAKKIRGKHRRLIGSSSFVLHRTFLDRTRMGTHVHHLGKIRISLLECQSTFCWTERREKRHRIRFCPK